ncbi:MAG: PhoH family protein [Candidatus Taylorbacteria bacterium]|nr:PhoH family protein [Candidatus Taylorbacteria bacterium]
MGTTRQEAVSLEALNLAGSRLTLTGKLKKMGNNGSTRLGLSGLSVTIGDEQGSTTRVQVEPLPVGWKEIMVEPPILKGKRPGSLVPVSGILSDGDLSGLYPNTCLVLRAGEQFVLAIYKKSADMLRIVPHPSDAGGEQVNPRNIGQALAFGLIMDPTISLITLPSKAGTGKTLISLRAGLELIGYMRSSLRSAGKGEECDETAARPSRVIVCRSADTVGKELGYLPGDLEEKIDPIADAVYDALDALVGAKSSSELLTRKLIRVITPSHVRGRTLSSSVFVLDDAQNFSPSEMLTLVSRAGCHTKMIMTGDPMQVDNKDILPGMDGISHVTRRFIGWEKFGTITMKKGERSELADEAARRL